MLLLNEELHLKRKLSMFCALPQDYQNFLKYYDHSEAHYLNKLSGS